MDTTSPSAPSEAGTCDLGTDGAPRDLRQAILDAAGILFAERGYNGTSMREVVEAAGCTKPVIYYYFKNKAELFVTVLESHVAWIDGVIDNALRITGTVRRRMQAGLQAYLDLVQAHPITLRVIMSAERHPEQGQPSFDFEQLRQRHVTTLTSLFIEGQRNGEVRPDVDAEEAALALFGVVEHRIVLWLNGRPLCADFATRTIDMFFEGVRT